MHIPHTHGQYSPPPPTHTSRTHTADQQCAKKYPAAHFLIYTCHRRAHIRALWVCPGLPARLERPWVGSPGRGRLEGAGRPGDSSAHSLVASTSFCEAGPFNPAVLSSVSWGNVCPPPVLGDIQRCWETFWPSHPGCVCEWGGVLLASSGGEAGLLFNTPQCTGCRSSEQDPAPVSAVPSLRSRFNPLHATGV